ALAYSVLHLSANHQFPIEVLNRVIVSLEAVVRVAKLVQHISLTRSILHLSAYHQLLIIAFYRLLVSLQAFVCKAKIAQCTAFARPITNPSSRIHSLLEEPERLVETTRDGMHIPNSVQSDSFTVNISHLPIY